MFKEELPDSYRPTFLDLPSYAVPLLKEVPCPPGEKTHLTPEIMTYVTSLKGSIDNIKKRSLTEERANHIAVTSAISVASTMTSTQGTLNATLSNLDAKLNNVINSQSLLDSPHLYAFPSTTHSSRGMTLAQTTSQAKTPHSRSYSTETPMSTNMATLSSPLT